MKIPISRIWKNNGTQFAFESYASAFCRLTQIELVDKEFEKTPKRSIKRFMYSLIDSEG